MGIGYQDFFPEVVNSGFFTKEFEELTATVTLANQWISSSGVRVINVETIVLPNTQNVKWYQVVRIWHEVPDVNS
ncbi:hypothetical protein [Pedosphaera parvula]|uniref:Uncharacterized protein n=1 Tax=Pedosphaera parvula (strain Ellin514) TaxID=320771 RepID=B9XNE9_PEDPL|nr:hypothetical protein [Pedosphaera parvula]EEF58608.1 hypothetical protein Cflav_PD1509 [Pedosphaera parvula Ellin514]